MKYTIDAAGIHYSTNEHDAEERETDVIADSVALETVQRIAAKIEAELFGAGRLEPERKSVIEEIVMKGIRDD